MNLSNQSYNRRNGNNLIRSKIKENELEPNFVKDQIKLYIHNKINTIQSISNYSNRNKIPRNFPLHKFFSQHKNKVDLAKPKEKFQKEFFNSEIQNKNSFLNKMINDIQKDKIILYDEKAKKKFEENVNSKFTKVYKKHLKLIENRELNLFKTMEIRNKMEKEQNDKISNFNPHLINLEPFQTDKSRVDAYHRLYINRYHQYKFEKGWVNSFATRLSTPKVCSEKRILI